jgi:hypothetical protein
MAQYAQDYQTQSQGLFSYVQTQLANAVSWTALPGQMNKIVASSAGYVWGMNAEGKVFVCKEPCDGKNWQEVQGPPKLSGMPYDIAVDDQNVYILYTAEITPVSPGVNLTGTWSFINGTESGQLVQTDNTWEYTPTNPNAKSKFGWSKITGTILSEGSGQLVYAGVNGPIPMSYNLDSTGNTIIGSNGGSFVRVGSAPVTPPGKQFSFSKQAVDGSSSWSEPQNIPGAYPANPTIHLTDQFMFVGTQGCSKPCATGSWVTISQPTGSQGIVAASSGNTYALTNTGAGQEVYQSSGNGQGGWTQQDGLSGVVPLAVGADTQFILGVDKAQRVVRCSPPYTADSSCVRDKTTPYTPIAGQHTLTVNPRSYQTYIAASTSGQSGNLYQRVDPGTIDHSSALDDTSQYLTKMDSAVNALGSAAGSQGSQIEVGQIKQQAGNVIKRLADIREEKENTAEERERIKRNIQTMGGADMQWKTQVLQTIAITLAVVLVTYFALGFVLSPTVNMSIAIVVLLVGVGVAIYFAVIKE